MLLIAITQIFFWMLIGLLVLTLAFSIRGILSPIFTLLLLVVFGGGAFLCTFLSVSDDQVQESPSSPFIVLEDNSETGEIAQDDLPPSKTQKPNGTSPKPKPLKDKVDEQENEVIEVEDSQVLERQSPEMYSQIDLKLRTYKTKGSWGLGKAFVTYFEEKTGWKKKRKGNYEIELIHLGNFKQENGEGERVYIYSGGALEIKVNGSVCCCQTISIPEGLSDSKLVKAREKLKQSIADLMFEHRENVLNELQKCL